MTNKTLSLYIHWPWCKSKCPYCDFNSHTTNQNLVDAYMQSLLTEMQYYANFINKRPLSSIFFGGGTPSLMHPTDVEKLISASEALFGHTGDIEITLEANPTSSSEHKFKEFRKAGINRFSIGIQSLTPKHLKFLGREHNETEALHTIEAALSSGVNSVNTDFIFGLPDQDLNQWISELHTICELGTQHVSAYQLTIEPGTKFYNDVKKGLWTPLDGDQQADFINTTTDCLKSNGFNQYEVSNHAKDGSHCKHNLNIWQYNDYIGIGAGAHGRLQTIDNKVTSSRNYKKISTYIKSVENVEHGQYELHTIQPSAQLTEKLLMGLRTVQGCKLTPEELSTLNTQQLNTLVTAGMLQIQNSKVSTTPQGMLHIDGILEKILA